MVSMRAFSRAEALMFWYIVLGGAAVSAVLAVMKGQNPLIWFFTSVPGVPLLGLMPDASKGLGEQKRARREIGTKVGMVLGGIVVATAALWQWVF